MSRKVRNCLNCGWRRFRSEFIGDKLYFRCCLTRKALLVCNIHLPTSCHLWMGYYGDPLQLDYFGYQEFGMSWEAPDYCEGLSRRIPRTVVKDMTPIYLRLFHGGEMWGIVGNLHQSDFADDLAVTLLSNEQLFRLMRLDYNDRSAEPYGRFEVCHEIGRRVPRIFDDLGWPYHKGASYKNRYTGDIKTLSERYKYRAGSREGFTYDEWLIENGAFIFEHWYPEDLWEDSHLNRDGTQMELEVL